MTYRYLAFLFIFTLLLTPKPSMAKSEHHPITVNLPEAVIAQALSDTLPLQFDTAAKNLEGVITITSIEKLRFENSKLLFLLRLRGDNMHVVTKISGHPLRIKIGTVDMSFDTIAHLRFDRKQQILFIKPQAREPEPDQNNNGGDIGQTLLALFNGEEFPIELNNLEPIIAEASNKSISLRMEIIDIISLKDALQLQLVPRITTQPKKGVARSQ